MLRPLGSTGLEVSPVGFGCWQLGGEGWGRYSLKETQSAVRRAVELGVNVFDTAPIYGFGRSEELLAGALEKDRDRVVIVSKVGLVWDAQRRVRHDNRPGALREQLEGSLERLRRQTLDVLLLHWPDPQVPLLESVAALQGFQQQGLIRAWGIANHAARELEPLAEVPLVLAYPLNAARIHATESADVARAGEELLARRRPHWGFLAHDVLARGLLGGAYDDTTSFGKRDLRSRDARFAPAAFQANLARARAWLQERQAHSRAPAAAAIRAVLEIPGVSCCLVGIKNPAQIETCAAALTGA